MVAEARLTAEAASGAWDPHAVDTISARLADHLIITDIDVVVSLILAGLAERSNCVVARGDRRRESGAFGTEEGASAALDLRLRDRRRRAVVAWSSVQVVWPLGLGRLREVYTRGEQKAEEGLLARWLMLGVSAR